MASFRIATIGVPRFVDQGVEFVGAWREYDFAKLTNDQRLTVYNQLGTLIQVHPDDNARFADEMTKAGLEYVTMPDGRRRARSIGASPPVAPNPDDREKGTQPARPEQVLTDAQQLAELNRSTEANQSVEVVQGVTPGPGVVIENEKVVAPVSERETEFVRSPEPNAPNKRDTSEADTKPSVKKGR